MNLEILTNNKNRKIAISNLPTDIEVEELCNKLRDFLGYFGKVIRIEYMDDSNKSNVYAVITFDNEYSVNNLRKSLPTTPFYDTYLKINQEKTVQQIKPKCQYMKSNEEIDSLVLQITNIPNELEEDDIKDIFEEHGEISFLDIVYTQYETITAYIYYENAEVAKKIQKLMNRGKIEGHKIEIEQYIPIPSCLCISNINFNEINIKDLIKIINNYGEIKELEIFESNNCMYINFKDIKSAINLEDEISRNLLYDFAEYKVDFCVPIANNYKIVYTEENKKNLIDVVNKKRYNDSKDDLSSIKKIKKNDDDDDDTKEEVFESKPRKGNKKKPRKGSQAFWGNVEINSTVETKKEDKEVKKVESTEEEDKKVEPTEEEKKIEPKKEDPSQQVILNERKKPNRIRIALSKRPIHYTTEICYKDTKLNMVIHYIDGDKDKPSQIFEKNKSIKFKKLKQNNEFIDDISNRLGLTDDPSWSFCIGCINDDGDYTVKIKSDFENLEKLNNMFIKDKNILLYKEGVNFVALLPSDYRYLDLFQQIFVEETTEEKRIMDALGKWDFFIFIIFETKSKF